MMIRRTFLAAAMLPALFASGIAMASESRPYSTEALADAQASGKPVLIEVAAPWCPTCKTQGAIIGDLKKQERFKELVVLQIDFDSQKDLLRELRVGKQSTLIALKNGKETGRSTGETDPAAIEALVASAL
jgi:thioredoxin 1